ncbi:MAG TPA: plastocyanin/azurin family copper-binding protein [Actinomycetota bacterium]|nr:plastocyanin/azurin family copper-binding protein [Actinomycetota bacterium]
MCSPPHVRRGLAATFVALALVACTPASRDPGEETIHVRLRYSRFQPSTFSFDAGTTVTFVVQNADPIDHEFILGDRAVQIAHERGTEAYHPPRSGEMTVPGGQTLSTTYTFTQPGDLILGCHLPGHYAYGMRAVVHVA